MFSEELGYLLKLLPRYRAFGGERYILSRIARIAPRGSIAEMVFCRRCVSLYVPVVNSRARCDEDTFSIECRMCRTREEFSVKEEEQHSAGTESGGGDARGFCYYFERLD